MSIIANKLGRSLGLENVAEVPVGEVDNFDEFGAPLDSVLSDGTPTPESDTVELEIVYDEAHTGAEELEELAEAAQGIESIYNAMVEANENGGMTPQAAKYAQIALETYGVKYGITGNEMMGEVSLESFGDNQAQATTISMEGVKDTLIRWWEAIVKKFKELMAKISKYYQENWAAAGRLKKRAEAIKKKARNTNGSIDEKNIEDKTLWSRLNIQGGDVTFANLTKGLKDASVAARAAVTKEDLESKIENQFFKNPEKAGKLEINFSALEIKNFAKELINLKPTAASPHGKMKIGGQDATSITDMSYIPALPGNSAIYWGMTKSFVSTEDTWASAIGSFKYGVATENPDAKTKDSAKLPALNVSEVESICDIVIDNMGQITRNKLNTENHLKLVKTIDKAGKDFVSKIESDDNDVQNSAQRLLDGAVHVAKEVRTGNAAILRYNIRTNKAALSYCAKSLSNIKDKK